MSAPNLFTFVPKTEILSEKSMSSISTFDTSLKRPETALFRTKIFFEFVCLSCHRVKYAQIPLSLEFVLKITKKTNITENYSFFTFYNCFIYKIEFYI